MINKLICGYLKGIVSKRDSIPKDIEISCINFFGTYGVDGDLIVEENTTHRLNKKSLYQFSSILIKKGATLTAKYPKQILDIICFGDIILEENAKINLNGMGYEGGIDFQAGESYKNTDNFCVQCCGMSNYGGGGRACCWDGGGGGYGSYGGCCLFCCCVCCCNPCLCINIGGYCGGWGGFKYGDEQLTVLHFGSGGGGGGFAHTCEGGPGGGALRLECFGTIRLNRKAWISVDGERGPCGDEGGGGSGGSIHLIINDLCNLEMSASSSISSVGGRGSVGCLSGNEGGVGRIRIECIVKNKQRVSEFKDNHQYRICPSPFIG